MTSEGTPRHNMQELARQNLERLRQNPYPGRGIILGHNQTGDGVQIYWIMGRSTNSRNRIFVKEGDTVRTDAWDKTKVVDPSLIIYNAMRRVHYAHVVSNGDQTDTIIEHSEKSWPPNLTAALVTRTYEPDEPNFTPRISGISLNMGPSEDPGIRHKLSIIKREEGGKRISKVFVPDYSPGMGYCIHTYKGDGNPLPSFDGDPYPVPIPDSIDEIARTYWEALNKENRVALAVKTISKKTGEVDYKIINKLPPPF